jgi:hypothetical protein
MYTYLVQFHKDMYYFPANSDGKEASASVHIDVRVRANDLEEGIANAKSVIKALNVHRVPEDKIPLECLVIEEVRAL